MRPSDEHATEAHARPRPPRRRWLGPLAILVAAQTACDGRAAAAPPSRPLEAVTLPRPDTRGRSSLEELLAARRSVREYTAEPLTMQEIAQLFWSAQGVTGASGARTAPSAGALYPLEIYVATERGLFHYVPRGHRAELSSQGDVRRALAAAGFGQSALSDAPAIFVITAVPSRTAAKYGERADRYVALEAGHAAQNLLLQSTALDLGAVPIGAFDDAEVAEALRLRAGEEPLYLVPVGHPRR